MREGSITPQQRDWATAVQEKTGCRLGAILVAAGLIRRDAVYRVLARTWECDDVDLVSTPLDLSLLDGLDPLDLREEGWLPAPPRRREGSSSRPPSGPPPTGAVDRAPPGFARGTPATTTDWDILQSLHTAYRETVVEQATLGLWWRDHVHSARQTLLTGQRVLLGLVLAGLAAGIVLAPRPTITLASAAASLALLAAVLFRIVVCAVGMHRKDRVRADVAALDARNLPTYTVLVPVYQEADAVAVQAGALHPAPPPHIAYVGVSLGGEAVAGGNEALDVGFAQPGSIRACQDAAHWIARSSRAMTASE